MGASMPMSMSSPLMWVTASTIVSMAMFEGVHASSREGCHHCVCGRVRARCHHVHSDVRAHSVAVVMAVVVKVECLMFTVYALLSIV